VFFENKEKYFSSVRISLWVELELENDEKSYRIFNSISSEPVAKVVIPVQTGIQKFLQHVEKTGFPLLWE